jgi:hypothetical protein
VFCWPKSLENHDQKLEKKTPDHLGDFDRTFGLYVVLCPVKRAGFFG